MNEKEIPQFNTSEEYWEWYRNQPIIKYKKEDMISGCGIYIIKWDNNNYFYIGKSRNMTARMHRHLTLFRKGFHESPKLMPIYFKYGMPNFFVLKHCCVEELDDYEAKFLNLFKNNSYMLNSSFTYNIDNPKNSINVELTKEEFDFFLKESKENNITAREFIKKLK